MKWEKLLTGSAGSRSRGLWITHRKINTSLAKGDSPRNPGVNSTYICEDIMIGLTLSESSKLICPPRICVGPTTVLTLYNSTK